MPLYVHSQSNASILHSKVVLTGICLVWFATLHLAFYYGKQQRSSTTTVRNNNDILSAKSSLQPSATVNVTRTNSNELLDNVTIKPSIWEDLWWTTNLRESSLEMDGNGMIVFPKQIERVWIDVGAHTKSHLEDMLFFHSDLFLLGFEPAIGNYQPCSSNHHEQCVNIWAACTSASSSSPTHDDAQLVELYIQRYRGMCNSILKPNFNTSTILRKGTRGCVKPKHDSNGKHLTHKVPGIPLSSLLSRIPKHISVEYIKIDAQGYDLEVMKGVLGGRSVGSKGPTGGATAMMQQQHPLPDVVSLKAMNVTDKAKLLYEGQPTLDEIITFFTDKGWIYVNHTTKAITHTADIGEVSAFFAHDASVAYKVASIISKL